MFFKILSATGESCHGGTATWSLPTENRPGEWMPPVEPRWCHSGYHGTTTPLNWKGDGLRLFVMEYRGKISTQNGDKAAFEEVRLLREVTDEWSLLPNFPQAAAFLIHANNDKYSKLVSLSGANLSGAHLSDANLSDANLSGADLRGADLRGADLIHTDLRGANLRDANLSGTDLSGAHLSGTDLSGAHLSGADLSGAYLRDADLSGAHLSDANLSDANLSGADLSGANLRSATEEQKRVLANFNWEVVNDTIQKKVA